MVCASYSSTTFTDLELLDGVAHFAVAHVLLAHEVLLDPLLCVTHDQEGAADVAHLHLLRLQRLMEVRHLTSQSHYILKTDNQTLLIK